MINFTEQQQDRFKYWVCTTEKYGYDDFKSDENGMLMIGAYYVCKLPSIWHLSLIQDWLREDCKIAVDVYSELCTERESGFRFSADMMIQNHEVGTIHIDRFYDNYHDAFVNGINTALNYVNK